MHDAYFNKYTNIWYHGDFIQKTLNHGYIIFGRSDATLKPGGVRIVLWKYIVKLKILVK